MGFKLLGSAALVAALTGCVAPEEPAPPRVNHSAAAAAPAPAGSKLEDAPIPNRKMGAPAGDSIIRVQQ